MPTVQALLCSATQYVCDNEEEQVLFGLVCNHETNEFEAIYITSVSFRVWQKSNMTDSEH